MSGKAQMTLTVAALVVVLCAGAQGAVVWYTSESAGSGGAANLYSIDTGTGAITDRGEVFNQKYITDIAYNLDGVLYAIGWTNAQASDSKLYKFTPGSSSTKAQWETATVKFNAMNDTVNALMMKNGEMYVASYDGAFQKLAYDAGYDRWQVVKTGSLGSGIKSDGDLAFSADGSKLYITLSGGYLGTVNFDTSSADFGKVSIIGATGFAAVYGLAEIDGVLYGTTNGSGNYVSSNLVSIDPLTGHGTRLYSLGSYA